MHHTRHKLLFAKKLHCKLTKQMGSHNFSSSFVFFVAWVPFQHTGPSDSSPHPVCRDGATSLKPTINPRWCGTGSSREEGSKPSWSQQGSCCTSVVWERRAVCPIALAHGVCTGALQGHTNPINTHTGSSQPTPNTNRAAGSKPVRPREAPPNRLAPQLGS